jgi:hypothetical protein
MPSLPLPLPSGPDLRIPAPRRMLFAVLFLLLLGFGPGNSVWAQETPLGTGESLDRPARVYLDCRRCDESYLRRNLTFVDWVRDRKQADVHMMGTTQRTGGGGLRYRLEFIGQGPFEDLRFELTYQAASTLTRDERRRGLADQLRLGLVPFVSQTPARDQLAVTYEPPSDEAEARRSPEDDPWNQWVFEISGGGSLDLEAQERNYELEGEVEAERITQAWKLQFEAGSEYELDIFELDEETVRSVDQDYDVDADVVKTLGAHWGAGTSATAFSRTFTNTDLALRLTPAVEYNVFPYQISDQKALTVTYRVGPEYRNYRERTIFGKTREVLGEHSLEASLNVDQPWGGIFLSLRGSHYFHDPTKNRVRFRNFLNLQLVEGLSLRLSFRAELIQDQLYLQAGDASEEEVLLQRRELATNYEVGGSVGLSYTFGSIYNNVVNTRL